MSDRFIKTIFLDGSPEVNEPFIARLKENQSYGIFHRVDNKWIKNQGWEDDEEDAKLHRSADGEYYVSEETGWIYKIEFSEYIYTKDLGLR